ncbi:hypothetical protein PVAP13_9NG654800 [Panicum virgatum]|uniref:Uncharacterized protein n=1 Tax=Panicum virgatum TaxID=38727 RepID=A0A8T0N3L7_PANVG|nr:hypothetical protein PVAP13_9NG654800 [Panicum virgatum]
MGESSARRRRRRDQLETLVRPAPRPRDRENEALGRLDAADGAVVVRRRSRRDATGQSAGKGGGWRGGFRSRALDWRREGFGDLLRRETGDHRAIRFPIAGPAARGPGSGIEGIRGAIRWGPALSTDPCWCCCWCPCPGPGEGESEVPGPADDVSGVPCRLSPSRYSGGCWRSAKRRWCTGGATGS